MDELKKLRFVVSGFSSVMLYKLIDKFRVGKTGWDKKGYNKTIRKSMMEHAFKLAFDDDSQAVDVANFAMMLWWQSLSKRDKARVIDIAKMKEEQE